MDYLVRKVILDFFTTLISTTMCIVMASNKFWLISVLWLCLMILSLKMLSSSVSQIIKKLNKKDGE